ncbi:MAG: histidine phosphatase family protein [Rhodanobacter sp.]
MSTVENVQSGPAASGSESEPGRSSPEATASTGLHLFLIRHGETEWAVTGQHTGRTDIPLTARGQAQAVELGQQMHGIEFARVFTSPLMRARQTCERVASHRAFACDPDLAEWDYGDYEGKTSADIRRQRPGWNVFRDGCPHGESPAQVSARADRLIARLRQDSGNIALFSHGQFGAVLAARWVGLAVAEARHLSLDVASTSILSCDPHHPEVPVIALWNRVSPERFKSSFATPMEP